MRSFVRALIDRKTAEIGISNKKFKCNDTIVFGIDLTSVL